MQQSTTGFPLFAHQESAVDFLEKNNYSAMIAHEPGLGKTRTGLTAFERARIKVPDLSLLVIAPISLLEAAWHEDMRKFVPHLTFHNVHKNGWPFGEWPDVLGVNYEHFQREDKVVAAGQFIRARRVMAALDESSKMKNHASLTTKHLLALRTLFTYRIVMSGTPAPNDESEYWAQMEFVCPGILGKSFNKFRRTYFYLRGRGGQAINTEGLVLTRQVMSDLYSKQGAEYAITDKSREELFRTIGPKIHAAKKEECLDLPEQIDQTRLVQMGPRQKIAYNQMKRHLVAEMQGQDVVAQVALAKLMKLREITSGFAISENQEYVETDNPKLKLLDEILDELGDRQAIIWGNFTWEIEKIVQLLQGRAIPSEAACTCLVDFVDQGRCPGCRKNKENERYQVATLYGKTKDREDSINGFISGKYRYLVANPHSAAHGLTFVNCSHQIFFSLDYSWEAFEQAKARTHRAGQKQTCVYFYLVADGSIDQEILAVLKKKGDMQELVFQLRGGSL